MIRKILSVTIILGIIIIGYLQKGVFLEWIHAGGTFSVLVSILFIAILAFFPIVPFIFAAGVIGAVFGTWAGSAITLSGALLGAMVMFALARYGFRNWAQEYLQKYPKAKEYESYFEKNAFLGILLVRVIPVVPSPAVNILSGITLVPWHTFLLASAIGKLPSNLIFNLAGSSFGQSKLTSVLLYGIYFLVITVLAYFYMKKQQSKQQES